MRLRLFHHGQHATAEVVLSRRNLLALQQKLDMERSARTLVSNDCPPGLALVVRAEDDEEHYADRAEPPGPMHPLTEAFIREGSEEPGSAREDQDIDDQELPEGLVRPAPGYFTHQILGQGDVWFDRFGRLHRLEEMSVDYLFNVMAFLERRAAGLFLYEHLLELSERLAGDAEEKDWCALDFGDPLEWLRSTPLVQALAAAAEARLASGH